MRSTSFFCRAAVMATAAAVAFTIVIVPPAVSATSDIVLQAEFAKITPGGGSTYTEVGASGGQALLLSNNGTASAAWTIPATTHLVVRARGDQCKGAPRMELGVDGLRLSTTAVSSTAWTDYSTAVGLPWGSHQISVKFANDYRTRACDRNLRVDTITAVRAVAPGATGDSGGGNVLAGATLFVDPSSSAALAAADLRSTDPTRAALLDKIAGRSQADWIGDWIGASDVAAVVTRRFETITAAGALPVLVVYAIPARDCGGYSAGGVATPDDYRTWIREVAKGVGGRRAAVVLEPDSLASITCLPAEMQKTRLSLLADAVGVLAASGAQVYLDGGHSGWVPADTMATRLSDAGVGGARGFALNVSNFRFTSDELNYGRDLSQRLGGRTFVVDTSRNGLGPASGMESWCNPSGRALGMRPTVSTRLAEVDAYLWVKRPGRSDGTCNSGPTAGTWWTDYAVGLGERAAW